MTHAHPHSTGDPLSYPHEIRKTLWLVLALNWFVAVLKLIFGYLIKSASLVADGYHSLADGSSNIIGLFGIRIASQPKDRDHPYGHKKYETFTSIFISFLLFIVCFHILHDSLERFRTKVAPQIDLLSFGVLVFTMLVNFAVMSYEYRKGRRLGSDILVADSIHTRSDILTSFSVIFAFAGVKLGYPVLDAAVALFITVFIGYSAIKILRSCSAVLCDTAVIDSKELERLVLNVAGVRRCHKIRTRGRQDDIHIDLHVLVADKTPLIEAHDLSSKIEQAIKANFRGVTDVIVHMEPLSSESHHDD